MPKVVDVLKWLCIWSVNLTFKGHWNSRLNEGPQRSQKLINLEILHLILLQREKVIFADMAGGGHIGFLYCGARGSVADKHLSDLLCLGTH